MDDEFFKLVEMDDVMMSVVLMLVEMLREEEDE
jgi:hypothetical protein